MQYLFTLARRVSGLHAHPEEQWIYIISFTNAAYGVLGAARCRS